jgi:hypothetical protein
MYTYSGQEITDEESVKDFTHDRKCTLITIFSPFDKDIHYVLRRDGDDVWFASKYRNLEDPVGVIGNMTRDEALKFTLGYFIQGKDINFRLIGDDHKKGFWLQAKNIKYIVELSHFLNQYNHPFDWNDEIDRCQNKLDEYEQVSSDKSKEWKKAAKPHISLIKWTIDLLNIQMKNPELYLKVIVPNENRKMMLNSNGLYKIKRNSI